MRTNLSFFTLCFGHRSEKLSSFKEQSGRGTENISTVQMHTACIVTIIYALTHFFTEHLYLMHPLTCFNSAQVVIAKCTAFTVAAQG